MDPITIGVAALAGIVANLLYDVLKKYLRKSSESRRVSVKLPSGQEYEIDSPVDDNEQFNRHLRSLIYSTEPMSIDKKENVPLLGEVVTPSVSEAHLNRVMVEISREIIIITDSTKFGIRSLAFIVPTNKIHKVITDDGIPEKDRKYLLSQNIDLMIV